MPKVPVLVPSGRYRNREATASRYYTCESTVEQVECNLTNPFLLPQSTRASRGHFRSSDEDTLAPASVDKC